MSILVAKVGGSLYDWPGLRPRLGAWLAAQPTREVILVPGGGAGADVIRGLDACHRLGDEASHWLALRVLQVNAHFLAHLLPNAVVCDGLSACRAAWERERVAVLDMLAFAQEDDARSGALPHTWDVTSDALSVRVARGAGAERLVLLKSITLPEPVAWDEVSRQGLVDRWLPRLVGERPAVEVVNLRVWQPG